MGLGGQSHVLAALPQVITRYTLYRRLGGPQGRSESVRKISSPSGFDSWTVHTVASRVTTEPSGPTKVINIRIKMFIVSRIKKSVNLYTSTPHRHAGKSRGVAPRILYFGTKWKRVVKFTARPL